DMKLSFDTATVEHLVDPGTIVAAGPQGLRMRYIAMTRTRVGRHDLPPFSHSADRSVGCRQSVALAASVERMGDALTDMVVLTTGQDAYRRRDGVAVIPLALLGP